MSNVIDIVKKTFEKLESSKTIREVDEIIEDKELGIKNFKMDDTTYPEIKFKITKEEIEDLKDKGIITDKNLLASFTSNDTLSKLLYSVLWKNGDLKKIQHIIEGILSKQEEEEREKGLVFHQFGKYLTKKSGEPIIDQHVLRAFGIFKATNQEKIERLKRLSIITKRDKDLIEEYKFWLRTGLTKELTEEHNYSYHVDKVLFALGKSIKE